MKILVTGSAGFIGSALSIKLLDLGFEVLGIDNHNNYYNPRLKEDRLNRFISNKNYTHYRFDLKERSLIEEFFHNHKPQIVVNLAAQAGVRYSIEDPYSYIDSNLVSFGNILECCKKFEIEHLVYASSSSVYGANTKIPFSTKQNVDHPLSLYAATKKANELMAHSYSNLYKLPTTGLRFFTVYGPWDRPDMALQKFAQAILKEQKINVFNNGEHSRDFTYIDDIVEGIVRVLKTPASPNSNWSGDNPDPSSSNAPWRIYNLGNSQPTNLIDYINLLEKALGKKAIKNFLPIQPGDVKDTWADVDELIENFSYKPLTSIELGVTNFAMWFKDYYDI